MGDLFRGDDLALTPPDAPDPGLADGYPTDPDPGTGTPGSKITAFMVDYARAVLHSAITALGGTPTIDDITVLGTILASGVNGIKSAALGTGVVSTTHWTAVVASEDSEASAARSVVAASIFGVASGIQSFVAACYNAIASGLSSACLACYTSCASAARCVVVGSQGAENATANSIGGGYKSSGTFVPGGTNQNLTWLIKSVFGIAHFAKTVMVGGDVNAGTGATITLSGATGGINASGTVSAAAIAGNVVSSTGNVQSIAGDVKALAGGVEALRGDFSAELRLGYWTAAATYIGGATDWQATLNKPHGEITITNSGDQAWAEGDEITLGIENLTLGAGTASLEAWVVDDYIITPIVRKTSANGGSGIVYLRNLETAASIGDAWSVTVRFRVTREG